MRFPINVVTASVDLSVDILNIDLYEWDYFMSEDCHSFCRSSKYSKYKCRCFLMGLPKKILSNPSIHLQCTFTVHKDIG